MTDIATVNQSAWSDTQILREFRRSEGWSDRGERAALESIHQEMAGRRILDIGVGAGRTVPLLRAVSEDYQAIDFVEPMVEACRAKHPGVAVEWGDARQLHFADDSFDLVAFSWNGIDAVSHHDRQAILTEVHRVLAPGGVFLFSVHNQDSDRCGEKPWTVHARDLLHPRFLAGLVKGLPVNLKNHRRLRAQEEHCDGWSVRNAAAHHFTLVIHYATYEYQRAELAAAGFDVEAVFDNETGRRLPEVLGTDRRRIWWFQIVARKH